MRVIIITGTIFPNISPRAFRSTELACGLAKLGHDVTVYAILGNYDYKSFQLENKVKVRDLGKSLWGNYDSDGNSRQTLLNRAIRRLLYNIIDFPRCEYYFKAKKVLKKESNFDLLITIAHPYGIHWGAASYKKSNPQKFGYWISDCGDPFMGDPDVRRWPLFQKPLERFWCEQTDKIAIPVENGKSGYYEEFHDKIVIIPQSVDFSKIQIDKYQPNPIVTFLYSGAIYPGMRDPSELLEYLSTKQIDFRFIVYSPTQQIFQDYFERLGPKLQVRHYIPRKELIREMSKMDFLININNDSQVQTPSKLIDYSLSQRPILNISTHLSDDEKKAIDAFLVGDYTSKHIIDNLEQFDSRNVSKQFVDICMSSQCAYVIGGNHHNTLGIIRSLGQSGIFTHLLVVTDSLNDRVYISKSKYIKSYRHFVDYKSAIDYLLQLKKTSSAIEISHKDVIICCSDAASSAVDLNLIDLSKYYVCPNAGEQGAITRMMSKEVMAEYAKSIGLTIPLSYVVSSNQIPSGITYPVIIKPLYSINGSKSDIQVFNEQSELENFIESQPIDRAFQVQQFIDKEFEYQYIGCSFDSGDNIIIPGVAHIIRPSRVSNTGFLKYVPIDDSFDVSKPMQLIKMMRYSGLFSVEFIRGKDGEDYFMEVNFRNDGNAISVTAAGVNLPYLWFAKSSGMTCSKINNIVPVYVMPEFDDLAHVYHRNITIFQWLRDSCKSDAFMVYDKHDINPFYARIGDYIRLIFAKIKSGK